MTIRIDRANPWSVPAAGGPQPGNVLLMDYMIATFGGTNNGIYNPRPVRGGSTPSIHRDGRANDWKQPDHARRKAASLWLVSVAEILQCQRIHFYSDSLAWDPIDDWDTATGEAFGERWADWLHIELNKQGAANTTPIKDLLAAHQTPTIKPLPTAPKLEIPDMFIINVTDDAGKATGQVTCNGVYYRNSTTTAVRKLKAVGTRAITMTNAELADAFYKAKP